MGYWNLCWPLTCVAPKQHIVRNAPDFPCPPPPPPLSLSLPITGSSRKRVRVAESDESSEDEMVMKRPKRRKVTVEVKSTCSHFLRLFFFTRNFFFVLPSLSSKSHLAGTTVELQCCRDEIASVCVSQWRKKCQANGQHGHTTIETSQLLGWWFWAAEKDLFIRVRSAVTSVLVVLLSNRVLQVTLQTAHQRNRHAPLSAPETVSHRL